MRALSAEDYYDRLAWLYGGICLTVGASLRAANGGEERVRRGPGYDLTA